MLHRQQEQDELKQSFEHQGKQRWWFIRRGHKVEILISIGS